ncbi:MAG TPA: hypothetical protein VI197_24465, partial [Polyangiaceae bacterium]
MPELRVLTEHMVKTSIERSIASLLDRQRELEAKVERSGGVVHDKPLDFEAKLAAAIAPLLAKQQTFEATFEAFRRAEARPEPLVGAASLSTRSAAQGAMTVTVDQVAMRRQSDALAAAALSGNALVDIPAELNGSRRKRVVVFL